MQTTKKYSLTVLNARDYRKIADKYPIKVRERIINSKGFTDLKRNLAFIRSKRDKTDMAGTTIHELLHLMGEHISEKEQCRLLFKDDGAQVKSYTPQLTSEQSDYYNNIYKPYTTSQYQQYKDVYEPSSRQLGGELQAQLSQPLSLPEDVWNKTWQQSKEKIGAQFDTSSRQLSQRLASTGAIGSSGQANKAFQQLDYQKQKSIETQAIDHAIAEWTEKKQAKQQSISNMQSYLSGQPSFNMQLPSEQGYITQDSQPFWQQLILAGIGGGSQIASASAAAAIEKNP
jgi:hypothetical protein